MPPSVFLYGAHHTTIVLRKRNVNFLLTATVHLDPSKKTWASYCKHTQVLILSSSHNKGRGYVIVCVALMAVWLVQNQFHLYIIYMYTTVVW